MVQCSNELSYLLHYYSTTEKQYDNMEPIRKFEYRPGKKEGQITQDPKLPKFRVFAFVGTIDIY